MSGAKLPREFRDVSDVRLLLMEVRRLGDGTVDAGEVLDLLDRAERGQPIGSAS